MRTRQCILGAISTALVFTTIVMTTLGQSVKDCEYYSSGKAICDGTPVNVAAVLCGDAFDKTQCVTTPTYGFEGTTVYLRGTPTGLPAGPSIDPLCTAEDFPENGGIAMALVRYGPDGAPISCNPYGTLATSYARYSRGPTGLFSVGVVFRRGDNVLNTAILNISCVDGGPTSFFRYTVQELPLGSVFLHTTVDCFKLEPRPLSQGYWFADNSTCLYGPKPTKLYKGPGNQADCEDICHPQLYECKGERCVESSTGIPLRGCLDVCPEGPEPAPLGYWCVDGTCLYGPRPGPDFLGGTKPECEIACVPRRYMCMRGKCVESAVGGTLDNCERACDPSVDSLRIE